MKYYSEITKSVYDSEKELKRAEKEFLQETEAKKVDETATAAPTKKQLANNVEEADKALKEANSEYEAAQKQVEELSQEYLKAVEALLEPAKKKVKEAQKNRYDAIKAFNDSYGAYHVTYTGDRAANEFKKALESLDDFNSIFKAFFRY